jgi:hypothetical protein
LADTSITVRDAGAPGIGAALPLARLGLALLAAGVGAGLPRTRGRE